jgi:hypothetical protein
MKQPSIRNRLSIRVVPWDIQPKRWGDNANMVPLYINNERYVKKQICVYHLEDMLICTNLKRYHMSMKKYMKGWK